ncbi:4461_t:CDS:2 [Dentiscutata erythropus]|uniref:4461_t:CDS:1 n=1 Tax=Dentiscutata erythropus TaxID=1348616 RepID=A0A9N9NGL1_9GLOM|nr:4461_t:CDS:2 [Dentiscutata erythropus]
MLRDIFESSIFERRMILISPFKETNSNSKYQNSSNNYLNTLLLDLKIQQKKVDDDT